MSLLLCSPLLEGVNKIEKRRKVRALSFPPRENPSFVCLLSKVGNTLWHGFPRGGNDILLLRLEFHSIYNLSGIKVSLKSNAKR